jgi:hypothetical protein
LAFALFPIIILTGNPYGHAQEGEGDEFTETMITGEMMAECARLPRANPLANHLAEKIAASFQYLSEMKLQPPHRRADIARITPPQRGAAAEYTHPHAHDNGFDREVVRRREVLMPIAGATDIAKITPPQKGATVGAWGQESVNTDSSAHTGTLPAQHTRR